MNEQAYRRLEGKLGEAKAFQVVFPNLPKNFWDYCMPQKLVTISNDLPPDHEAQTAITERIQALRNPSSFDLLEAYDRAKGRIKTALLEKIGCLDKDYKFWTETYCREFHADLPLRDLSVQKIVSLKPSLEQWLNFMDKIGRSRLDEKWVHFPLLLGQVFALAETCSDWIAIRKSISYWHVGYDLEKDLEYGCLGKIVGLAEELHKVVEHDSGGWKEMFDLWEEIFQMSINHEEEKNRALDGMVKAARNVSSEQKFHCWTTIFERITHYCDRIRELEKVQAEALEEIKKADAAPNQIAFRFEIHKDPSDQYSYGEYRKVMLAKLKSVPMVVRTVGSWVDVAMDRYCQSTPEVNAVLTEKFGELWSREQPIPLSFKHLFQIAEGATRRGSVELLDLVAPLLIKAAGTNVDKLGKILNLDNLPKEHQDKIGEIIRKQI